MVKSLQEANTVIEKKKDCQNTDWVEAEIKIRKEVGLIQELEEEIVLWVLVVTLVVVVVEVVVEVVVAEVLKAVW